MPCSSFPETTAIHASVGDLSSSTFLFGIWAKKGTLWKGNSLMTSWQSHAAERVVVWAVVNSSSQIKSICFLRKNPLSPRHRVRRGLWRYGEMEVKITLNSEKRSSNWNWISDEILNFNFNKQANIFQKEHLIYSTHSLFSTVLWWMRNFRYDNLFEF